MDLALFDRGCDLIVGKRLLLVPIVRDIKESAVIVEFVFSIVGKADPAKFGFFDAWVLVVVNCDLLPRVTYFPLYLR